MATYAIGDIQGCYAPLRRLLKRIKFDPRGDRLWLVGDLVNRGPQSLDVLRWAADLGDRARVVLGNHDVHLIARHDGVSDEKKRDTLDEVLEAKDAAELVDWLAARPLVVREGEHLMVHAGLPPDWTPAEAERLGREASTALRGKDRGEVLRVILDDTPKRWSDDLGPKKRLQFIFGATTRIRIVDRDSGALHMDFSGAPEDIPKDCVAWFDHPARRSTNATIIFGHWAALGLHVTPRVIGLDSGCVWGKALSAYRLEDGKIFQEPASD